MRAIAAISTPHGKGGVALIRVSGDGTREIVSRVFAPMGHRVPCDNPRMQIYGSFLLDGQEFDDGLCCFFPSPHSFTGEDVAEMCCHGGVLCAQKLLTACIAAGAAYAGAGEFTRRAFISGKLSLTRAEAIGSLIDAKTDAQMHISLMQSRGALSHKIQGIFDTLSLITASAYAYIDYPTEDLTDLSDGEVLEKLKAAYSDLDRLCSSHTYGKAISDGLPAVIVGKPNVGKSSLLNFLAGDDRAIVTPKAGTTRDVITVQIRVGDLLLDLSDTAGIRNSDDEIELIGVQKSLDAMSNAAVILAVFDASRPLDGEDAALIKLISERGLEEKVIAVINKCDLRDADFVLPYRSTATVSAKTGQGFEQIESLLKGMVGDNDFTPDEILLGSRQYAAALSARDEVGAAIKALEEGFTNDIALMNVESALAALGELDGSAVSEKIVDDIFSHFCVGK